MVEKNNADNKKKILFLCTHNAARSQMAEGFINALFGDQYLAFSAGNEPTEVHPCTVTVMAEVGIDISTQRAKSLEVFDEPSFDYVVTLCANAREACPIFPGGATYLHNPFDDPSLVVGPSREQCALFRHVRDKIRDWIEATFAHYPQASDNPGATVTCQKNPKLNCPA